MKYIVVLGDGMADWPVKELGGLTPLEAAKKPHMDFIASNGRLGLVKTIPEGMSPGSDTANLSVLGYDPKVYHTGRSPLEAVSIGVNLFENDLAYRCNFVTTHGDVLADHSAGDITTEEARVLVRDLAKALDIELHVGTSYRHCLVLRDSKPGAVLVPPHDIIGQEYAAYLPSGANCELFRKLIACSRDVLDNHPINLERKRLGKNPANSIWLWGEGKAPSLPSFHSKFNKTGAVISAVDLIKGIGICIGFQNINVAGATGRLDTNFEGKVAAALSALETCDFVYLHIEAPDECGHQGQISEKVLAIEYIDERVVGPVMVELDNRGVDYSILILPDHPTPLEIRTHTSDPVPFAYYRKGGSKEFLPVRGFDEKTAEGTGDYIRQGHLLMEEFIVTTRQ